MYRARPFELPSAVAPGTVSLPHIGTRSSKIGEDLLSTAQMQSSESLPTQPSEHGFLFPARSYRVKNKTHYMTSTVYADTILPPEVEDFRVMDTDPERCKELCGYRVGDIIECPTSARGIVIGVAENKLPNGGHEACAWIEFAGGSEGPLKTTGRKRGALKTTGRHHLLKQGSKSMACVMSPFHRNLQEEFGAEAKYEMESECRAIYRQLEAINPGLDKSRQGPAPIKWG
eukprot:gene14791-17482_t